MLKKKEENNQPLISIVLLAYNHLDYTKYCIESLLKYASHLNFELITIDNGSTDNTKEYFNVLPHVKKVQLEKNQGVARGFNVGFKLAEGKYILAVNNNVVFTENAIDNLLKCIESDKKIGLVVPSSNYASNMQQIECNYSDLKEMHDFAKKYNLSNIAQWEERIKLVTYTWLIGRDLFEKIGWLDEDFNLTGFNDDCLSFIVRRAGYKLILAKDTFVHHFDFITSFENVQKENFLSINRDTFRKKFGVDAWNDTKIDSVFVEVVSYKKKDTVTILGIDPLCGGTLLQIKNKFKENGVKHINLYTLSHEKKYIADLESICDCILWDDVEELKNYFTGNLFDYIIIEKSLEEYEDIISLFHTLRNMLKKDGFLIFSIKNLSYYVNIANLLQDTYNLNSKQYLFPHFDKYALVTKLCSMGYTLNQIIEKHRPIPHEHKSFLQNMQLCFLNLDLRKAQSLLTTDSYIFSVSKN